MNRPILFNTEMVKAILDGRKTQTRRIIKPQPSNPRWNNIGWIGWDDGHGYRMKSPCEVGDVLWVRETWAEMPHGFVYRADGEKHEGWDREDRWRPSLYMPKEAARIFLKVRNVRVERLQSISHFDAINEGIGHIFDNLTDADYKSWAARSGYAGKEKSDWPYTNYLWHGNFGTCGTGNKISDAWPYQYRGYENPRYSFSSLWNSTVPMKNWDQYGWEANPWVFVIAFERCEMPERFRPI